MAVACGIIENGLADEVWLMPCKRNPLKEEGPVFNDSKRLEMLAEAIEYAEKKYPYLKGRLKITDIELKMPEPSFTYKTLEELERRFPEMIFRIAVGSDSYLNFEKWRQWEWIEHNFSPVVYPRPGHNVSELRPFWTFLEGVELVDISSTELRHVFASFLPWLMT